MIFNHHLQYRIQDLDFDIEIIELSLIDGTFGFDSGNGSFNGLIGVLQRGDADIAAQVNKKNVWDFFSIAFWVSVPK